MIALSFLSLTTSISYSFHPKSDSSINTSVVGDNSNPRLTIVINSSSLFAIPPPLPPSVKEGRIINGYLIEFAILIASSNVFAISDFATSISISPIAFLKSSLSSAVSMASFVAPIISTLYLSSIPLDAKSSAVFNAV